MIAIYRRELRGLFRGIMAWLLIAGWLMLGSLFVVRQNLGGATSLFANAVLALSDYIVLGMPFLAARCFTKDQSNGTMLWLRSLPVSATGLFLGKYLAALTVFAIPTAFLAVFPMLLDNFGYLSYGSAYTALFGYFLLGASWLAICCWVASVCRRVWVAFLATLLLGAVVYLFILVEAVFTVLPLVGLLITLLVCAGAGTVAGLRSKRVTKGLLAGGIPALLLTVGCFAYRPLFTVWIPRVLNYLSLFARLEGFCSGYFDLSAVALYGSLLALSVFFAVNYPLSDYAKGGKKQ